MSKQVLVDPDALKTLIDLFVKRMVTTKDLDARILLTEQLADNLRIRALHPGPGFTPEGQADYREEYESWPVQELAAEYARETFKAQLLLEILSKRLLKDNQQGTPL